MKTIGDRVRYLCKGNGITIRGLERKLGYANGSIRKAGDGIQYRRVKEIAEYFGKPAEWIYSGDVDSLDEYSLIRGYKSAPEGRQESVRALLNIAMHYDMIMPIDYDPFKEFKEKLMEKDNEEKNSDSEGVMETDGRQRVEENGLF